MKDILSEREAAEYLGLSVRTLQKWRWQGGGPLFAKLGSAVRYRIEDLDDFFTESVRKSTSEPFAGE